MPRNVRVLVAQTHLPNGGTYGVNQTVILTDSEYNQLNPLVFTDGTLTDLGEVGPVSETLTTQAAHVANPAALASVQNATAAAVDLPTSQTLANALKANYNTLQADVVALRTTLDTLITNLQGAGKPMA